MSENTATAIGNIQLSYQLPNGASISSSVYLLEGEDEKSINSKLDMLNSVFSRQRKIHEVPLLEGKRDQMQLQLKQLTQLTSELTAKESGGKRLATNEKQNLINYGLNIERITEELVKIEEEIKKAKEA